MTFALFLQLPNHLKFKRPVDIWANFVPQVLFLQSIFGYLAVCIVYKWTVDWSTAETQPPSLLNMIISMFLEPGSIKPENQLYRGQGFVQTVLLLIAAVCVPWMLITKPYLAWKEMHKTRDQGYIGLNQNEGRHEADDVLEIEEEGNGRAVVEAEAEEEHHDFTEVIIHQVIHTIEFCLGCISHTASYLRLWALSLAHAQLSEVLWNMTIAGSLSPSSLMEWIGLLMKGALWLQLTIGILCVMEVRSARSLSASEQSVNFFWDFYQGLSAFLHALRLHWVEANSKHFEGGGYVRHSFD